MLYSRSCCLLIGIKDFYVSARILGIVFSVGEDFFKVRKRVLQAKINCFMASFAANLNMFLST